MNISMEKARYDDWPFIEDNWLPYKALRVYIKHVDEKEEVDLKFVIVWLFAYLKAVSGYKEIGYLGGVGKDHYSFVETDERYKNFLLSFQESRLVSNSIFNINHAVIIFIKYYCNKIQDEYDLADIFQISVDQLKVISKVCFDDNSSKCLLKILSVIFHNNLDVSSFEVDSKELSDPEELSDYEKVEKITPDFWLKRYPITEEINEYEYFFQIFVHYAIGAMKKFPGDLDAIARSLSLKKSECKKLMEREEVNYLYQEERDFILGWRGEVDVKAIFASVIRVFWERIVKDEYQEDISGTQEIETIYIDIINSGRRYDFEGYTDYIISMLDPYNVYMGHQRRLESMEPAKNSQDRLDNTMSRIIKYGKGKGFLKDVKACIFTRDSWMAIKEGRRSLLDIILDIFAYFSDYALSNKNDSLIPVFLGIVDNDSLYKWLMSHEGVQERRSAGGFNHSPIKKEIIKESFTVIIQLMMSFLLEEVSEFEDEDKGNFCKSVEITKEQLRELFLLPINGEPTEYLRHLLAVLQGAESKKEAVVKPINLASYRDETPSDVKKNGGEVASVVADQFEAVTLQDLYDICQMDAAEEENPDDNWYTNWLKSIFFPVANQEATKKLKTHTILNVSKGETKLKHNTRNGKPVIVLKLDGHIQFNNIVKDLLESVRQGRAVDSNLFCGYGDREYLKEIRNAVPSEESKSSALDDPIKDEEKSTEIETENDAEDNSSDGIDDVLQEEEESPTEPVSESEETSDLKSEDVDVDSFVDNSEPSAISDISKEDGIDIETPDSEDVEDKDNTIGAGIPDNVENEKLTIPAYVADSPSEDKEVDNSPPVIVQEDMDDVSSKDEVVPPVASDSDESTPIEDLLSHDLGGVSDQVVGFCNQIISAVNLFDESKKALHEENQALKQRIEELETEMKKIPALEKKIKELKQREQDLKSALTDSEQREQDLIADNEELESGLDALTKANDFLKKRTAKRG